MSVILPPPYSQKQRNSSIELFRIIATFSVLIVHFNGWFVGGLPERLDFGTFNWRWGQFLIGGASCVCVNLFIIISGYFGLKFKISNFVRISLVLIGIYIPFYLLSAYLYGIFSFVSFLQRFLIVSRAGYFVQCYLMLIFFSPVLNAFIDSKPRKDIFIWVMLFWLIEIWFGCIMNVSDFGFNNGYSIIHFVLIYMLARVVFLYRKEIRKIRKSYWCCGYLLCTLILAAMYGVGIRWDYANPVNVISLFCFFIPFLYYNFQNKTINWIAKSTFAVYIIQVTNPAINYLIGFDTKLLNNYSYGVYLAASLAIIILFFSFCIIYDKVREFIMRPLEKWLQQLVGEPLYNKSLFT